MIRQISKLVPLTPMPEGEAVVYWSKKEGGYPQEYLMGTWEEYKDYVHEVDPDAAKDMDEAAEVAEIVSAMIEQRLAERYAELHSMSVEEAFKAAVFEKIEDEYDAAVGEEAYAEYVESGKKSSPASELWTECGL